jgi:hypothetical protein
VNDDRRCTATSKQTHERCKNAAIAGGNVCRFHGGRAGQVLAKAKQRVELAKVEAELVRLGGSIDVDPGEALLVMVKEAAWNVAFLRELIAELPTHPVVLTEDVVDELLEGQPHGGALKRKDLRPGTVVPGLYGPDHNGDGKPHILVAMYEAERDRLVQYSGMALKAGVEERRLRLVEADVQKLFEAVSAALAVIPAEHREAFRVELARKLRAA